MNFVTYFTDFAIQQQSANNENECLVSSQSDELLWLPQEDIISSPNKVVPVQPFDNFPYPDSFSSSEPSSDLLLPTEKSSESCESLYEPENYFAAAADSKSKKINKGNTTKSTSANTPSPKSNKRNLWSAQEDAQVVELVKKFGTKWAIVASNMKNRNGKQVRDRYINYLLPNIKTDLWTEQEDQLLINLTYEHGNKWKLISTLIPGRTENQVKSRYYTHLKKRAEDGKGEYLRNQKAEKVVAKAQQPVQQAAKATAFIFPTTCASNSFLSNDKQIESVYPQWTQSNIDFQAAPSSEDAQMFNSNLKDLVGKLDCELLQFVDLEQPTYLETPRQDRFTALKSRKAALEMVLAKTHAEIQNLEVEIQNDDDLSAFLDY